MKESIKMIRGSDKLSESNRSMRENRRNAQNQKNVFFNMYKMYKVSAETFGKNCLHNII